MDSMYVVLFTGAVFVSTGWWVCRASSPAGRFGSMKQPLCTDVIHLCGVLMIALGGVAVTFVTFALFAPLFLFLLGAVFVGTGWGIHRELIVSRRFGNMRRPIFRWTSRIYAMTMVFAGVFAVILAAAMRFLAVSHVVVPSVLASCAAAWVLRPRGARVIDVPSDDSVESSFIRHVTGLLCFGLVCIVMLAGGTALWITSGFDQPNDRLLERRFNEHRTDFERIAAMMNQDHNMGVVGFDRIERMNANDIPIWPRPASEWGISEGRWNDYKALFRRTGVGAAFRRSSGNVELDAWHNVFIHGTHIAYIHCGPRDLGQGGARWIWPCVEAKQLGNGEDNTAHNGFTYAYRYKKIGQDWYILEVSY